MYDQFAISVHALQGWSEAAWYPGRGAGPSSWLLRVRYRYLASFQSRLLPIPPRGTPCLWARGLWAPALLSLPLEARIPFLILLDLISPLTQDPTSHLQFSLRKCTSWLLWFWSQTPYLVPLDLTLLSLCPLIVFLLWVWFLPLS